MLWFSSLFEKFINIWKLILRNIFFYFLQNFEYKCKFSENEDESDKEQPVSDEKKVNTKSLGDIFDKIVGEADSPTYDMESIKREDDVIGGQKEKDLLASIMNISSIEAKNKEEINSSKMLYDIPEENSTKISRWVLHFSYKLF